MYTLSDYYSLIDTINHYNHRYYHDAISEISDSEYDILFDTLKKYEQEHPERIVEYSPTQTLFSQSAKQTSFQKASHKKPMLSLENTYNQEDLWDRQKKIIRIIDKLNTSQDGWSEEELIPWWFSLEPKYDGVSVELVYDEGMLKQAITRWDGIIWEDITINARMIKWVPHSIPYQWSLTLRWEIIMPKSAFEQLNQKRSTNGEELFANTRNAAAGSIKQLDPAITAERGLLCYVYEIVR